MIMDVSATTMAYATLELTVLQLATLQFRAPKPATLLYNDGSSRNATTLRCNDRSAAARNAAALRYSDGSAAALRYSDGSATACKAAAALRCSDGRYKSKKKLFCFVFF